MERDMEYKIITPTVTIFNSDGKINNEENIKLINYLIDNGVNGLAPLGSTGEFTNLELEEKKEFIKLYVDTVDKRAEIIAGTSSMNFEEVVELSNYAISIGVKGVLILPPWYFGISQDEAYKWYDALAESIDGNIYIYNFEARTGFNMTPETTLKLAMKHKNIKGMKDSTNNVSHTKDIIYTVLAERPDFEVYSGFDEHFIPNISAGGSGCISALSNFEPKLWSNWVKAARNGVFNEITYIQKQIDCLMELYSVESNFSLMFKKFLEDDGIISETNTIFPFNEISLESLVKSKNIRQKSKEIGGKND